MTVVFDTNIVISASFWRGKPFDCLSAWARGEFVAAVSPQLLSEYFETLEEMLHRYPGKPFVPWAQTLTESADLIFPAERAPGATDDPDDEMVLECARAAGADFLVSGDKRHLLKLRTFRGVKIVTCDHFLSHL